jgi:hypothetical protein
LKSPTDGLHSLLENWERKYQYVFSHMRIGSKKTFSIDTWPLGMLFLQFQDGGLLRFDELFKKAWEQSSESEESDDAEDGGLDLRLLIGMGSCIDETVWVLSFAEGS